MFCIGHMTTLVAMELVYSEQSCAHLKPRVSTVMKSARKATRKCPTVSDTIFNTHLFYLGRPFRRHFFFSKMYEETEREMDFSPFVHLETYKYLPIIYTLG